MSLAFVFPGQGSQSVGMLSSFADDPVVRNTFKEASEALGYDLWELCQSGPAEELNQTDKTQPALLTASVALWRLWQEKSSVRPEMMAGHSLGEYSALVAAGVLSLKDAVVLVEARGQFMQQAVPAGTGKMAAIIGLDDAAIIASCEEAAQEQVVSAVNFNSPGQVVIAGNVEAVERAMELCKEKGAKRALPLPVSVPSHCALMKPAADQLAQKLAAIEFAEPQIPVINNVDVKAETSGEDIKLALIRQLYSPVRWTETVQAMQQKSVNTIVECGAGNVLSGLAKRISRDITSHVINDSNKLAELAQNL